MNDQNLSLRASALSRRLGAYFREFLSSSPSIRTDRHLDRLARARAGWRHSWESLRSGESPERILLELFPHPRSSSGWAHPIAEETDEVSSWHAKRPESSLVESVMGFLDRVAREPEALPAACEELHRSLPPASLPPAILTPMLSALAPERFVALHRHSLRVASLRTGVQLQNDVAAYPDANRAAFAWLEEMAPVGTHPPADRFESFCRWLIHEKKARLDEASFTVTPEMYKDWPPMW